MDNKVLRWVTDNIDFFGALDFLTIKLFPFLEVTTLPLQVLNNISTISGNTVTLQALMETAVGDVVYNVSDGSNAVITQVLSSSTFTIGQIVGGTTNTWTNGSQLSMRCAPGQIVILTQKDGSNNPGIYRRSSDNTTWVLQGGSGSGVGDVTASGTLTADTIILGGDSKTVKSSSKTIVTLLGADDTTLPTSKAVADVLSTKANNSDVLHLSGGDTVAWITIFSKVGIGGTPKGDSQLFIQNGSDVLWTGICVGTTNVEWGMRSPRIIGGFALDVFDGSALRKVLEILRNGNMILSAPSSTFLNINVQNSSSATTASSDVVATADTGSDTTKFINMGINSSLFSNASWTINGALDGYLYTQSNGIAIGTVTAGQVGKLFSGGTLAANERLRWGDTGVSLTGANATARLHLPAGTATAGTAPLKLTTGTALTTAEDGALEYHGSHLYFTIGSTRYQLDQQGGGGLSWGASITGATSPGMTLTLDNYANSSTALLIKRNTAPAGADYGYWITVDMGTSSKPFTAFKFVSSTSSTYPYLIDAQLNGYSFGTNHLININRYYSWYSPGGGYASNAQGFLNLTDYIEATSGSYVNTVDTYYLANLTRTRKSIGGSFTYTGGVLNLGYTTGIMGTSNDTSNLLNLVQSDTTKASWGGKMINAVASMQFTAAPIMNRTLPLYNYEYSATCAYNSTTSLGVNMAYFKKTSVNNTASGTFNTTGSVVSIQNVVTQSSSWPMNDTCALLDLNQAALSNGGHIRLNAYTPPTEANVPNNTIWNTGTSLKFKDDTGTIKTVTLT